MSAIQSGSSWWIDSTMRFAGGALGGSLGGGAMDLAQLSPASLDSGDDDGSDSISSVISDAEQGGEIGAVLADTGSHALPVNVLGQAINSNIGGSGASAKISSAKAIHIGANQGVAVAAMRQHQASGVFNLDDEDARSGENADDASSEDSAAESSAKSSGQSLTASFLASLLQDPAAAFAATSPGLDRQGLLALLAN